MKSFCKYFPVVVCLSCFLQVYGNSEGKHLFILSGQSNMARFNEKVTFIPALEGEFGKESVIVVKDAKGGQPIRRWYKNWDHGHSRKPGEIGDLYDILMEKVDAAIRDQAIASVTFLWMQGEADAKAADGNRYKDAFEGLLHQLKTDLGREDLTVVIGRLSDFDMSDGKFPHWTMIRQIQVDLAESSDRIEWVDTDDLNDGINKRGEPVENELHYTPEGYRIFGERLAAAAIGLIQE